MDDKTLTLSVLPCRFGICRLDPNEALPAWAVSGSFFSVTRTPEELSLVCIETAIPEGTLSENGWLCLKVHGPLDFSMVGVLSSMTVPLAKASISVFVISTYETDYLLIKEHNLEQAKAVLLASGHKVLD